MKKEPVKPVEQVVYEEAHNSDNNSPVSLTINPAYGRVGQKIIISVNMSMLIWLMDCLPKKNLVSKHNGSKIIVDSLEFFFVFDLLIL